MHKQRRIRGVMLIEVMLALLLSMGIFSILILLYVAAEKNHAMQVSYYEVEDNSQIALQIISRDIQQTGFVGCARLTADFPVQSYAMYALFPNNKIMGTNTTLVTRFAGMAAYLQQSMLSLTTLFASSDSHFSAGDMAIISDCYSAEIFRIKTVFENNHIQKIISELPLHKQYNQYSEISHFEINTYYVAKTKRTDSFGKGIYALYRRNAESHVVELVEGVEQLLMTYDVNENGSIHRLSADAVSDWAAVIGVHIQISLRAMHGYSMQKIWNGYAALQ
jgi:type IV pilus assembly protein PilW